MTLPPALTSARLTVTRPCSCPHLALGYVPNSPTATLSRRPLRASPASILLTLILHQYYLSTLTPFLATTQFSPPSRSSRQTGSPSFSPIGTQVLWEPRLAQSSSSDGNTLLTRSTRAAVAFGTSTCLCLIPGLLLCLMTHSNSPPMRRLLLAHALALLNFPPPRSLARRHPYPVNRSPLTLRHHPLRAGP